MPWFSPTKLGEARLSLCLTKPNFFLIYYYLPPNNFLTTPLLRNYFIKNPNTERNDNKQCMTYLNISMQSSLRIVNLLLACEC